MWIITGGNILEYICTCFFWKTGSVCTCIKTFRDTVPFFPHVIQADISSTCVFWRSPCRGTQFLVELSQTGLKSCWVLRTQRLKVNKRGFCVYLRITRDSVSFCWYVSTVVSVLWKAFLGAFDKIRDLHTYAETLLCAFFFLLVYPLDQLYLCHG